MTISDIARLAGVSKATVSRAFSNPSAINENTRKHVLEIARQYNFRPNSMAQAVANQKSRLVGFCLYNKTRPFFGHTFFGPVLDNVLDCAKEFDYHVVLAITNETTDLFEQRFIEDSIEGAILCSFLPERMAAAFQSRNTPIVLINDELTLPNAGYVLDDNYGGAQKLVAHLVDECGYTSIAFLGNRLSHPSNMLRYIGFVDALQARGLTPYTSDTLPQYRLLNPEISQFTLSSHIKYGYIHHVGDSDSTAPARSQYNTTMLARYGHSEIPRVGSPVIFGGNSPQAAYNAVQELLDQPKLPRAIFCGSDSLAVGVVKAIRDRGLRVPEDIAVTGYDDIEASFLSEPPITTISVDRAAIGRTAMTLLKEYIDGPTLPSKAVYIENQLIVRRSTCANA